MELVSWVFIPWLFAVLLDPFQSLAQIPPSLLTPVPLLQWLHLSSSLLLSPAFLWGLKISMLISLSCVLCKRFTLTAAISSAVLLTLYQAILRCFKPYNNHEFVALYAVYIFTMILINSKRTGRIDYSLFSTITLGVLVLTYFFAGASRILTSGVEVFFDDSLRAWSVRNRDLMLLPVVLNVNAQNLEPGIFYNALKLGFIVATLFECLAPVALFSKKFAGVFLWTMLASHFFSLFFLNLLFWQNMLLLIFFIRYLPQYQPLRLSGRPRFFSIF